MEISCQMRRKLPPEQSRIARFLVHMTSYPGRWCTEDEMKEISALYQRAITMDPHTCELVYMPEEEFIQELKKEPIKSILIKLREGMGLSFIYGNEGMR